MKVFLSWSGDRSKAIAEVLREWLPSVLQSVKPYFSPDDIVKGARWSVDIASQLDECQFGIICLTKTNLLAPWIQFEAGALAKNLDKARVIPLLVGVAPADVSGPLTQFQMAAFGLTEIRRVLRAINAQLPDPLDQTVLESTLTMWWPKLEERIKAIPEDIAPTAASAASTKHSRTERQLLEELLELVRNASYRPQPAFEAMLVEDLDLQPSLIQMLRSEGIETIDQLCKLSEIDLLKRKDFGRLRVQTVQASLRKIGRALLPNKRPLRPVVLPDFDDDDDVPPASQNS
jgi:hypothetical protein